MQRKWYLGQLATDTLNTTIIFVAKLLTQTGTLLLLASYLSSEDYGYFSAIAALSVGIGTLSSFGVGYLVAIESAKSDCQGLLMLERAIPAAIVSFLLLLPLLYVLCIYLLQGDFDFILIACMGAAELLLAPCLLIFSQRLQGLGRIASSQAILLLPFAMRLFLIGGAIFIFPEGGISFYMYIHLGTALVALFISSVVMKDQIPMLSAYVLPSFDILRRATPFALMRFTALNPAEIDKALAFRVLGASDAGVYSLASRAIAFASTPVSALTVAIHPRIAKLIDVDLFRVRKLIGWVMFIAAIYGVLAGLAIAFIFVPFFAWLLTSSYPGIGETMLWMAWVAPLTALRFTAGGLLIPLERPMARSAVELIALTSLIVLALPLGTTYGITGVIYAVLVSEGLMALLISIYLFMITSTKDVMGFRCL